MDGWIPHMRLVLPVPVKLVKAVEKLVLDAQVVGVSVRLVPQVVADSDLLPSDSLRLVSRLVPLTTDRLLSLPDDF